MDQPAFLCSMEGSKFFYDELRAALSENSYGFANHGPVKSTAIDATTQVQLLEGKTITVILTSRGFSVSKCLIFLARAYGETIATLQSDMNTACETLENLLAFHSEVYKIKHQDQLFLKLHQLSEDRKCVLLH
jgi:hypothetical protein